MTLHPITLSAYFYFFYLSKTGTPAILAAAIDIPNITSPELDEMENNAQP